MSFSDSFFILGPACFNEGSSKPLSPKIVDSKNQNNFNKNTMAHNSIYITLQELLVLGFPQILFHSSALGADLQLGLLVFLCEGKNSNQ